MNGLSLFTGSGIGELVLKEIIPGYRTVGYVEWDKFCQRLIQARIKDGHLDDAPIWDDVRTFDGRPWAGRVDLISGGFPCQPFSVAGKRKAQHDERNMWPDTFRLISEIRPRYALLENVPGLLAHQYIRRVFGDLASIGYDCEWDVVGASDVGANHRRKRLWILAYSKSQRTNGESGEFRETNGRQDGELQGEPIGSDYVAHPRLLRPPFSQEQTAGVEQCGEDVQHANLQQRQIEQTGAGHGCQDVADTESTERKHAGTSRSRGNGITGGGEDVPDSSGQGLEGQRTITSRIGEKQHDISDDGWWTVEPNICGMADGMEI